MANTRRRAQAQVDTKVTGQQGLKQLQGNLDKVGLSGRNLAKVGGAVAGVTLGIQAAVGAAQALRGEIGKIIEVGNLVERQSLTWEALLGNVEDAEARFTQVQKIAAKAPFELTEINDAAIQMEALGKFSERALTVAGDAAAIFGRQIGDATQALLGAAKGELEMLKRFGVAKFELAEKLGKDIKDISFQTREDLDEIFGAALEVMEDKFGGGMERLVQTTAGQMTMLTDAVFRARKAIAEGGLTEGVGRGLALVLERMEQMEEAGTFARIGESLGGLLNTALDRAADFLGGAGSLFDLVSEANKQGRGIGFAEFILGPGLSGIEERRTAVSLLAEEQRKAGVKGSVGGLFGLPARGPAELLQVNDALLPAVNEAALILINGGTEQQARDVLRKGAIALAFRQGTLGLAGAGGGSELGAVIPQNIGQKAESEARSAQARLRAEEEKVVQKRLDRIAQIDEEIAQIELKILKGDMAIGADPILTGFEDFTNRLATSRLQPGPGIQAGDLPPIVPKILEDPALAEGAFENLGTVAEREVDRITLAVIAGTETWESAFESFGTKGVLIYEGIGATAQAVQQGITAFTMAALEVQGTETLKFKNLANFVWKSMAAGIIEAQAKVWANLGKGYLLQAGAFLALGEIGSAAKLAATGAGLLALAGVATGVAGALSVSAEENLRGGRQTAADFGLGGGRDRGGDDDGFGGRTTSPGGRLVGAGAAPQTVNYIVNVQAGTMIFGNGGTREWLQDQVAEDLQDLRELGQI